MWHKALHAVHCKCIKAYCPMISTESQNSWLETTGSSENMFSASARVLAHHTASHVRVTLHAEAWPGVIKKLEEITLVC